MTDTLTIDESWVGKYVKLRNGRQAYISGIIPEKVCRGFGFSRYLYFSGVEGGEFGEDQSWGADGRYYSSGQSERDIISLWEDEEPHKDNPLIEQAFQRIEALEDFQKSMTPSDYYPEAWRTQLKATLDRIEKLEEKVEDAYDAILSLQRWLKCLEDQK